MTGTKLSMPGEEAASNPSFVRRLRRGTSPQLTTVDRVRSWMAAHAREDELRAIRDRLTDITDPFAGTTAPGAFTAPLSPAGSGADFEREGEMRMNENGRNYLSAREAAAWLGLSPGRWTATA